ncbi:glyoxalase [Nocardia brasiliensis]|uniref:glyoxalase n=1 Tax=Nocardia brasiliensis TaxID=37326 RepID=UPI003D8B3618
MNITTDQITIDAVTLEVADPAAAAEFYAAAFGLGDKLRVRASDAPTSGFRGFILSLVVSQPSTVDSLVGSAVQAGATIVKPAKKSFWGYGAVVQAPDGAIWKIATSAKKDTGPATREIDDFVVLFGVDNVKATKQFYADRGLPVGKSFGSKYVEFEAPSAAIKLALYGRKAAAKDAGVAPEGSGSHRIVLASGLGAFADPDGFEWEPAPAPADR